MGFEVVDEKKQGYWKDGLEGRTWDIWRDRKRGWKGQHGHRFNSEGRALDLKTFTTPSAIDCKMIDSHTLECKLRRHTPASTKPFWPYLGHLYSWRRRRWRVYCAEAWLWQWGRGAGTWARSAPCPGRPRPATVHTRRPAAPATETWSPRAPDAPQTPAAPAQSAGPFPSSWRCASRLLHCRWQTAAGTGRTRGE